MRDAKARGPRHTPPQYDPPGAPNGRLRPRAQLELVAIDRLPPSHHKYLAQPDPGDSSLYLEASISCCLRCLLPRIRVTDTMAEPIGLASGLLTLAGFAFQASIALYQMVQSFQFHPKQLQIGRAHV